MSKNKDNGGSKFNKLLAFAVALVLTFSAATIKKEHSSSDAGKSNISVSTCDNSTTDDDSNFVISYDSTTDNEPSFVIPYDYTDIYGGVSVKFSSASTAEYMTFVDSMYTEYEYDNYYYIDEALELESTDGFANSSSHSYTIDFIDGLVDASILANTVIKNNERYQVDKANSFKMCTLKQISDDDIFCYCQAIADSLNYELLEHADDIDLNELKCILGNLKIFEAVSTSNAYVNSDDLLCVAPNMINLTSKINSNANALIDTLYHEAKHLIQKCCKDNLAEDKKSHGMCKSWDSLPFNPLWWQWSYESAAETAMCNQTGDSPLVYKSMIGYANSLILATYFNSNNIDSEELPYFHFQDDPQKLYDLFGCSSLSDKIEIIKMMATIDILQYERKDFYSLVGKPENDDELVSIQRSLKSSICGTLSKIFYRNLTDYVSNNPVTLDDIFYMIRVFEGDINSHIDFMNIEKFNDSENFIDTYLEMQETFFGIVAEEAELSFDDVLESYLGFTKIKDSKLPSEKLAFLDSFSEKLSTKYGKTIYQASEANSSYSNEN